MNWSISWFSGFVFCIWLMGLTPGCSKTDENIPNQPPKRIETVQSVRTGGVYRFPLRNNPGSLDPALVQDIYGITIVHQVFDSLVQFGPYLRVLPALAESWQVEEGGRLYRFFLRQGVRFHNGSTVTAGDVLFSLKRLLRVDPPPAILPNILKIAGSNDYREHRVEEIAGIQVLNDHILLIRLLEPHVPFLTALGTYQAAIVPAAIVSLDPAGFSRQPVGSGPFKFVSWESDTRIEVIKFPEYYAGAAFLDGIDYRIYPGGQQERIMADFLRRDLEEMPVFGDIRKLMPREQAERCKWYHRPSLSLFYYGMNCRHPNLNNPQQRKALIRSINRNELVQNVYEGQYEIAHTILPPGMPGYRPAAVTPVETDDRPTGSSASFKGPASVEIVCAIKSARVESEMEMIRRFFKRAGTELEVKYVTNWTEFEAYIKSDAVQIYRYDWTPDMPDPDSILYPLFASDSPVNFCRFKDDEVDRLLLQARAIVDPVERAAMYNRIESRILDAAPIAPLFYLSVDRVYQPYVQGLTISALGVYYTTMHRIWLNETTVRTGSEGK